MSVPLVLHGFGIGVVGHLLVHASWGHLIGNMLFLWVFGNAVAPRLGPVVYPLFYFGAGAIVGTAHVAFSDTPAVGASAAMPVADFEITLLDLKIGSWLRG